jgi:hypothetical protein
MGRQTNFYFTSKDDAGFLDFIEQNGMIIYSYEAKILTRAEADSYDESELFLSFHNAEIFMRVTSIEQLSSEVIQYSRSICKEGKRLWTGRIWSELRKYDDKWKKVEKNPELTAFYNVLSKWIKKESKISVCKSFYIGKDAYERYKNDNWIMVSGPKTTVEFD